MKKAKSRKSTTVRGRRSTPKSVEEYLAGVPEPARGTLNKIRATIRSAVPAETLEVISYGIPAFKHERVLVWYAGFSDHCSLFPTAAVIEEFKKELSGYTLSKGTIQFSTERALPAGLVRKMVKARLRQLAG
jgi:uncharacterized protein YdhG (YjbR/CyaY superfamily)